MPPVDGIDVSHYNTATDWSLVPQYALTTTKLTEGVTYPEQWLQVHRAYYLRFRSRGHRWRAAYHWIRSNTSAKAQADYFLSELARLDGLQRGEFVQLDWETTSGLAPVTAAQVEEWCDRIEQVVQRECCVVYSSDWVPNMLAWRAANPDRPYWHANYRTGTGPNDGPAECVKFNADIWQWGVIPQPGWAAAVDVNQVLRPAVLDHLCGYEGEEMTPEQSAKLDAVDLRTIDLTKQVADLTALVWKTAGDLQAIKHKLGIA